MDQSLIPSSSHCSSSSSNTFRFEYQVFISFRGEDTRKNFTSHIHDALVDKNISTFIDYNLNRGDEISSQLLRAIDKSRISVIVFSQKYASSRWCLEELAKIVECKNRETNKQIVIPVFYWVDPSDVRHQTGSFADAFAEHEERFRENLDKVQRWKNALQEAANLSGYHIDANGKTEAMHIKEVVKDILERLNNMYSPSNNNELVGIASKIEKIVSLLDIGKEGVLSLGIWGMGGIGKTTLADAVYNKIYCQFDGHCICHVKELSERSGGEHQLQQKKISKILKSCGIHEHTSSVRCTFTWDRFCHKKLLIVFDDVSDFEQIEFFIKRINWLNSESRIIITTRDNKVLQDCGVNHMHKVQGLFHHEAVELFSRHAFKGYRPATDYMELINIIVKYAGGVPLALKVLGSHLRGSGIKLWEHAIKKLEKKPPNKVQEVLKISYDGLDCKVKEMFLDIACFFKWKYIGDVKSYICACGYDEEFELKELMDKCLIDISRNMITMHDLLQVMAWRIVNEESENPGERSRLWDHNDIYSVLTKNKGTEKIKGISLDMSQIKDIQLNRLAFAKMKNLRFLEFYNSDYKEGKNKVLVSQGLKCDFSEVRYLSWDACPLESLPSSNHLENLVTLQMCESKVKHLWSGVMHLDKLKEIDLSSSSLTICPDLSGSPNLQKLKLCFTDIEELSLSIKDLSKLRKLDLSNCERVKCLPSSICNWKSLEYLCLDNCCKLEQLPDDIGTLDSLEHLQAHDAAAIKELPPSITALKNIRTLKLHLYESFKVHLLLPDYIVDWQNLRRLSLRGRGITKLFDNLGCLSSLESLNLAKNSFESIPESIINLSRLESLDITNCKRLECLPKLPYGCVSLMAQNCTSLKVLVGVSSQNGIVSMDSKSRKKKFEVHFGNCLKLDAKEVEGFCQSFWQNVTREREVEESVDDWACYLYGWIMCRNDWVYYPGSEAPSGFDMRMGSFIKVDLPLNLISLLLCVVVDPIPDNDRKYWCHYWCHCFLKYKDKNLRLRSKIGWFVPFISNHVFLLKFQNDVFRNFFRECHQRSSSPSEVIEASFRFTFNTNPYQFSVGFKIVQWGVHFISAHTTENFHESLIENETQQIEVHYNSLEEDEPHPKPLKLFPAASN